MAKTVSTNLRLATTTEGEPDGVDRRGLRTVGVRARTTARPCGVSTGTVSVLAGPECIGPINGNSPAIRNVSELTASRLALAPGG